MRQESVIWHRIEVEVPSNSDNFVDLYEGSKVWRAADVGSSFGASLGRN